MFIKLTLLHFEYNKFVSTAYNANDILNFTNITEIIKKDEDDEKALSLGANTIIQTLYDGKFMYAREPFGKIWDILNPTKLIGE